MVLDRTRGFHRLHHQETLLQFLDVDCIGIELLGLQRRQARPQALLALALLGVVVKALAVLAAETALLFDQLHHQLLLIRVDGIGTEIGFGCLDDLEAEVEGDFIRQRQRTDRHARHLGAVLDHRRRHAFEEHLIAFGDVTADAAVGVEAAGVIHHDRRLADHPYIVERGGERDVAGVLAEDDFDQHHLLDRREEVDADELALLLEAFGQRSDRQR